MGANSTKESPIPQPPSDEDWNNLISGFKKIGFQIEFEKYPKYYFSYQKISKNQKSSGLSASDDPWHVFNEMSLKLELLQKKSEGYLFYQKDGVRYDLGWM